MNIFIISLDFLENIKPENLHYLSDILFIFTNTNNDYKVAVDSGNEIWSMYHKVENNAEYIKIWLDLLTYIPNCTETINVDLKSVENVEDKFLELCANIRGKRQMIVYSKQNISLEVDCNDNVEYQGKKILLLDKEQARLILNDRNIINNNFINAQVAGGNINGAINRN